MLDTFSQHAPTTTIFEKKRINALMRLVLARLRKHKVGVSDIVSALSKHGYVLNRAQFDDLMTTRPERDSTLSVPAFQSFITIIFRHDAEILSAEELLDFVNVMRVPVSLVGYFRSFVSRHAWNAALTAYGLSMQHWDEAVIGREKVVENLMKQIRHSVSCVVTGHTGAGKTAVAVEVMRRVSLEFGVQTYYLDARNITSLSALNDELCATLQLLSVDNQVSSLRLKQFLRDYQTYIVIDDFRHTGVLSLQHVIRYLATELPQLVCLFTTPHTYQKSECAPFVLMPLPELPWDSDDSVSAILVQRAAVEYGAPPLSNTVVRTIRVQTKGNPLSIRMATIHFLQAKTHEKNLLLSDVSLATYEYLNPTAHGLFEVLIFLDMHLPVHVLKACSQRLIGQTPYELTVSLQTLQAGGFVVVIQGFADVVVIQNSAREALGNTLSMERSAEIAQRLCESFCESAGAYELLTHVQREYLNLQMDIPTILAIIQTLLRVGNAEGAAAVLMRWSVYFVRHGHIAKAIGTIEHCLSLLPEGHKSFYGLQRTLGELYGIQGTMPQSNVHFKAALNIAIRDEDETAIAQLRVLQVGTTFNRIQRVDDTNYLQAMAYLNDAEAHFASVNAPDWLGRAQMQRADLLNFGGNQTAALYAVNESLVVFQQAGLSEWYADALRVRGTIYLAVGDYVGARQDLQRSLEQYEESNQIIHRLQCHIRLAMLLFILGDLPEALGHLERGMQFMHIVGGYKFMLSAFDIFAGILRAYGDDANAQTLRERADAYRAEWQLYRSAVLDQLIDSFFVRMPLPAPRPLVGEVFASVTTMQDVASVLMRSVRFLQGELNK